MNAEELKRLFETMPDLRTPQVEVRGDLPHLRATITSGSFSGIDEADRQEKVWAYLRNRAPEYATEVDFIFTNAPGELWDEDSEFFDIGSRFAPGGVLAARQAVQAKCAGDDAAALRFAQQALDSDRPAQEARAAGRPLSRGNVVGNAWSGWYEALTGRSSGW